jgi:hypothetical protein
VIEEFGDNSKSGAVYTGCAMGGTAAAPCLCAANFNAGTVDVSDGNLNLNPAAYNQSGLPEPYAGSSSFSNPAIPGGFAPFNVQNIAGGKVDLAIAQNRRCSRRTLPLID